MIGNNAEQGERVCNILLVEDNPGDVRLTQEVFRESAIPVNLEVARDGVQALEYLAAAGAGKPKPLPDMMLLDLNLPRKDGREVLSEVKTDPRLLSIPVLVLTTSKAERDINACYALHANCYLSKPLDLDDFVELVRVVELFWLKTVLLPTHTDMGANAGPA